MFSNMFIIICQKHTQLSGQLKHTSNLKGLQSAVWFFVHLAKGIDAGGGERDDEPGRSWDEAWSLRGSGRILLMAIEDTTEMALWRGEFGIMIWMTNDDHRWSARLFKFICNPCSWNMQGMQPYPWCNTTFQPDMLHLTGTQLLVGGWQGHSEAMDRHGSWPTFKRQGILPTNRMSFMLRDVHDVSGSWEQYCGCVAEILGR